MAYVSTSAILTGFQGHFDSGDPKSMQWLADQIEEAELVIEARIGDLATWVAADPTGLRARTLRRVVIRVVRRVLRNPEGYKAEADGDYSYQLDPRVASGSTWVTDDDWALLGVGARRVGTIRLATGARGPR